MTKKDIKEIVEEFWIECHGKSAYKDGWIGIDGFSVEKAQDWLREALTTLTQQHKTEVERAVAKEKVNTLIEVTDWLLARKDVSAAKELNEAMLKHFNIPPTKTNKQ